MIEIHIRDIAALIVEKMDSVGECTVGNLHVQPIFDIDEGNTGYDEGVEEGERCSSLLLSVGEEESIELPWTGTLSELTDALALKMKGNMNVLGI